MDRESFERLMEAGEFGNPVHSVPEWDKPIPFSSPNTPDFPVESLPGAVGAFVGELAEAGEFAPPPEETTAPVKGRVAKPASAFGEDNTKFLWYPYLPIGDYSVMMADGGTGKTILCCGIAAAVSTGKPLPGEMFQGEGKRVLMISAEDSGEILKKRLFKSGGDLDRVMLLDCSDSIGISFSDAYDEFEATIKAYSPALVIIDPWWI